MHENTIILGKFYIQKEFTLVLYLLYVFFFLPFVLLSLWCETIGVLFLRSLSKMCLFWLGSGVLGSGSCQCCNSELCFPVKCCPEQNSNTEQKPNRVQTHAAPQTRKYLTSYKEGPF